MSYIKTETPPNKALRLRRVLPVGGAFVALATGIALPALAAAPAGAATPVTFTLTAGSLAISAPTGAVSLGSQVAATSQTTMSGQIGTVTVTDQRGGPTTWTASVISTAFTPTAGPADPASNVSYAAGVLTHDPSVTPVAADQANLTGVVPIVTAAQTGIGTTTWNPTISVMVPANFAPGVYVATVTHSVA